MFRGVEGLFGLISVRDCTKADLEGYLKLAEKMEANLKSGKTIVENKIVATMFFESSTRTNMSFQAAAHRLGAKVITFSSEFSSSKKGETLVDTVKIIDGYADILVIRHPGEGAARLADMVAKNPVVNAGDGGNQHPTQTLIDLYTIRKAKGEIEGLSVHLVGDLKHARAMRSLVLGLAMFNAKITLIAPKGLEMDREIVSEARDKHKAEILELNAIDLSECDVLYVCRIQKERFSDLYEAAKVQKEFRINEEYLENAKAGMIILHPLPKIDEIPESIDESPKALYFQQAKNGIPVRMAVLAKLLDAA